MTDTQQLLTRIVESWNDAVAVELRKEFGRLNNQAANAQIQRNTDQQNLTEILTKAQQHVHGNSKVTEDLINRALKYLGQK